MNYSIKWEVIKVVYYFRADRGVSQLLKMIEKIHSKMITDGLITL